MNELSSMMIPWLGTPGQHQVLGVASALEHNAFAFFWEPGAGKTYATVHAGKERYARGEIDLVVIILPNSIKQVWPSEVAKWASDIPTYVQVLNAGDTPKRKPGAHLEFLVLAVESLSQGGAYGKVMAYIKDRRALCVLDESSRIKNPGSIRTKKATDIGWSCYYRLILTGTPVTQGPHDLFAQMRFLNPDIIGVKKWTAFRARYCVIGGFENRQIIGYQNIDELMDRIRPHCSYVRLEDCADIPEKIYTKISVPLSPEQKAAIRELKNEGTIIIEQLGVELFVEMALEKMTRIQQIVGGSLPHIDQENGGYKTIPMPGKNPKMDAMFDYIENLGDDQKCLIWARFTPERDRIVERLVKEYGEQSVVRYDGQVNDDQRKEGVTRIQEDPTCRFFVSNQSVGGIGLTLTAATYALNFSNTFSSEDRVQMENRNHRTGQTKHCVYVDFEAEIKEDKMILKALIEKKSLADMVKESIEKREFVI